VAHPRGRGLRWSYIVHALGEFGVTCSELERIEIDGEKLAPTFILKRGQGANAQYFSGVFEPNEMVLPHIVETICRRLGLKYHEIFG
jgi:hypothetical protein